MNMPQSNKNIFQQMKLTFYDKELHRGIMKRSRLRNSFLRTKSQEDRLKYNTLGEKCPYSELFWSVFSRNRAECGEIRNISPYSLQMRENTDQNNSEYRHFLHSDKQRDFCKNYREQLKIFSNLDIKKVINNRSFWKTVSPLFYTKCSKGDKIILNENDKCVSNDDELCQFFLWLLLQYYF